MLEFLALRARNSSTKGQRTFADKRLILGENAARRL
jgi:hypothetical protein